MRSEDEADHCGEQLDRHGYRRSLRECERYRLSIITELTRTAHLGLRIQPDQQARLVCSDALFYELAS